ncbi:FMN-binding negative transcriptional regulator [Rhizobium sp. L1K21]|uniref:FMN-binding negative transcriptional regulator n=1 Tax=Rhizobium sp. L1K21 TaxID=2954933 RepID=UPI002092739C|nr:FMN-binding negative transcriptional regulator [Rhizobium sp. L1K21]MCO6187872.1 FMN-binding negative transcriptional regulator [Rhizobium sp. L1K21]
MIQEKTRPYVPSSYRMDEHAARQMILAEPFALVVTPGLEGIIETTHTPLFFETGETDCSTLIGHIARINPQAADISAGRPGLAVFNGPSAYVSPAWYVEDEDVPTWIYQAVHVRGQIEPVQDHNDMSILMENIIAQSEARVGGNWQMDRIPQADIDRMMKRILGFRLHIEQVVGVGKLEQTRSAANRAGVSKNLRRGREVARERLVELLDTGISGGSTP